MEINEFEISMPWGIIAAKTWGDSKNPLILCLHGWLDNANIFNLLIPQLPPNFYYFCIDLPGHGKSSPLQSSLIVHSTDFIIVYKLIYEYLNRKKITIMAHSFGAMISLIFTQMYPQCVDRFISFDVIYSFPRSPNVKFKMMQDIYDRKFISLKNQRKNIFSKDEIIYYAMKNRMTPISKKTAEILTERNIEPVENDKFQITTDHNMKLLEFPMWSIGNITEIIKKFPITCPHLVVMSSNSNFFQFAYKNALKEFKKNPNFEIHVVEGNHEVILEHSERVAPLVTKFLLKHSSKL